MKTRIWARVLVWGLILVFPTMVQAAEEHGHGEPKHHAQEHKTHDTGGHGDGHGDDHGSGHDKDHGGGHGEDHGSGHDEDHGSGHDEDHGGGHGEAHGGGHGVHLYTSETTDEIGEIALTFIGGVLIALSIGIHFENKKHGVHH